MWVYLGLTANYYVKQKVSILTCNIFTLNIKLRRLWKWVCFYPARFVFKIQEDHAVLTFAALSSSCVSCEEFSWTRWYFFFCPSLLNLGRKSWFASWAYDPTKCPAQGVALPSVTLLNNYNYKRPNKQGSYDCFHNDIPSLYPICERTYVCVFCIFVLCFWHAGGMYTDLFEFVTCCCVWQRWSDRAGLRTKTQLYHRWGFLSLCSQQTFSIVSNDESSTHTTWWSETVVMLVILE